MISEAVRTLSSNETLPLPAGRAIQVRSGTVLVFVVPRLAEGPGRRIPVCEVGSPEVAAGADIPGADLLAVGLPGTRVVESAHADTALEERMRDAAERELRRSAEASALTAELQLVQAHHDERVVDDALLGLAAAVPGEAPPLLSGTDVTRDLATVDFMARQVGLHPDPLRLRRAVADADVSGRDPITALAAAAGASIRRVDLTPGWWRREGPPVLLTEAGSPAIAAGVWRHRAYHVWDPDGGVGDEITAATESRFSGAGILFEPLLDSTRPTAIRDLLRLGLRGSRNSLTLVLVLTAVVGLLAAVIPVVAGSLTQTVASQTTSTLLVVGCALLALAAGDLLLRAVRSYALLRIRGRGISVTATAVWERILRLPMGWHNRRTVASRMTDANAVDVASLTTPDSVITAMLDIAAVGGAILGVFTTSRALAFALLAFLVCRALVEVALVRRSARLVRRVLDATTESQSVTLDLISGVNRLRVSGASGRAFARWANQQATTTRVEVRQRRLSVVQQMTGALWPTLGLAVLFTVTAIVGADVGQLVTAQTALTAATAALAAAVGSIGALLSAQAVLRRAEAVLRAEPESGRGQEVAQLAGGIDLRDVVFRYRDDMPEVLSGVNLTIAAGSHVAIVGPSGCGKSTLLRLMLGLENPESGIVSYDGRDLSGLDRASVRRQIGAVMQSSQLMPGTIRDNVDLGRGLTGTDVWDALEAAAVADDVRSMPMGLSTVVVEGASTISGGQRQRILLARALAGQPRILLLDEATSALDNISQAAVVANLERLSVTRVVVAHRLSTIERADAVVMLSDGKVVAHGSFADLIETPGPFHELVERQRL